MILYTQNGITKSEIDTVLSINQLLGIGITEL
jgi:hypothetical protein